MIPRDAVKMVGITSGPRFSIRRAAFPEPTPLIAYCDDLGSHAQPLQNMVEIGWIDIESALSYMWLAGTRRCRLFQVQGPADATHAELIALSVGEFCMEIYYVSPDRQHTERLWWGDLALK